MKKIYCLIIGLFCSSCVAQDVDEKILDGAVVNGVNFKIVNDKGTCILKYKIKNIENSVALAPKPPCFFLRRGQTTPQHFEYADVRVTSALIVAGTLLTEDQLKSWNVSSELNCGSERQGILVSTNEIKVTKQVLRGSIACRNKGSDEKDFWFFAHQK